MLPLKQTFGEIQRERGGTDRQEPVGIVFLPSTLVHGLAHPHHAHGVPVAAPLQAPYNDRHPQLQGFLIASAASTNAGVHARHDVSCQSATVQSSHLPCKQPASTQGPFVHASATKHKMAETGKAWHRLLSSQLHTALDQAACSTRPPEVGGPLSSARPEGSCMRSEQHVQLPCVSPQALVDRQQGICPT